MATILIVHADETMRQILREICELEGYKVHSANYASEAIDLIKTVRPDVIIVEYISIDQIYAAVRSTSRMVHTQILPLGSWQEIHEGHSLTRLDVYLVVPFTPSDLLDAIQAKVERAAQAALPTTEGEMPDDVLPAGPAQAEVGELEHTGSMEPIDWDEAPAPAEASPEAEPLEAPAREMKEETTPHRRGGGYGGTGDALPATETQPEPEPPPPVVRSPAPGGLPLPRPQPIAPPRMQSSEKKGFLSEPEPVQFSTYYPREVKPDDWQQLQAYVFKESAADRVLADAEKQLGPLDRFRRILESARQIIREGDTIMATPNLTGFQFNPPSAAISFFEDWHRFDFKMRAKDAPLNLAANGILTFTVNGIIVADIPLSVFVTNEVTNNQPQRTPPQPIYDTVFASYSHKDTAVVLKVEAAAKAFGMTYLRDVITLRSGEDWSAGLEKMIDDATIFQMFWSPPYSRSQHCRREWEYAVGLKKESPHFIRPVYWLQPMPDPPPPLQHLHFAYQPDLIK